MIRHLRTGGKKVAGHNDLYCLSGNGRRYVSSPGPQLDGDDYLNATPLNWTCQDLAATEIQVMGQALGRDGNLWVTLPSGEDLPLAVHVAGDHYTVGVTPTRYHPYITDNGTPLDPDTVNVTNCVGQRVTFTLKGLPTPPTVVNMVGSWTLPAKFVNEQWQAQEWVPSNPYGGGGYYQPYGSVNYRINNGLLQNTPSTSCWYQNKPGGKVSVGMNLEFSNGQHASVAADGSFTVFRPKVTQFSTSPPFLPKLENGWLELGDYADVPSGVMSFQARVQSKPPFAGNAAFVQLADRASTVQTDQGFDFSRPGNWSPSGYWSRVFLDDNPGITSSLGYEYITDNFNTYLTFTPAGGIGVTLGIVNWGWSATESNWTLTSTNVNAPTCTDSGSFPVWTQLAPSHE